ncbi:MAG: hypothetical protein FWD73_13350 [Polyangiaceae bacterium]|nr:hypothetical protein [Polyangiaceae bacterium]
MGNNSIQPSWSRQTSNLNNSANASPTTASTPAPAAGASRPPHPSDADWQRHYDTLPETHLNLSPSIIPTPIPDAKRVAEVQAKKQLDLVRGRFSGPYKVDGASVQARPMFRMNVKGTLSTKNAEDHKNELVKICKKAHVPESAVTNARIGRPTAQQLVQVTQALIDAGKLPKAANDTVEMRIRQMQYDWGIGVDCAGYIREAAVAVHGKGAQSLVNGANRYGAIDSLLKTSAFKKVADKKGEDPKVHNISDIRTGDIIHLDAPKAGDVGHNVIVHNHKVATASMLAELSACNPDNKDLRKFLSNKGPIHVLNVDSSWGGGIDNSGFRRDTWLYNESSGEWGCFKADRQKFYTSTTPGPQDEIFKGAFRPSEAK